jgi:hypothetical protein
MNAARIASRGVAAQGKSLARSASMAKTTKPKGFEKLSDPKQYLVSGPGGATHQTADAAQASLTTNRGVIFADNQNRRKSGERGPSLLEDFGFREKITPFDHERIPERIVHARGSGAHGYFEVTNPIPHLKVIGYAAAARTLFARAGIADDLDNGVIELGARGSIAQYIEAAKRQRVWDREARLSGDDT